MKKRFEELARQPKWYEAVDQCLRIAGGELLTGGKAPAEEVAMVYQGRVKVTGCGESRELVRGDLFYCDGPLTYSALGGEESQLLSVSSPADASFLFPKTEPVFGCAAVASLRGVD